MTCSHNIDWNAAFFQPTDLPTALSIREHYGRGITPVAGATSVGRSINAGEFNGGRILDLSRIRGFATIDVREDYTEMGAGICFRQLERPSLGALSIAAKGVGGPAIRNRATLGGNLATARNDGDGSVAALALSCELELRSVARGSRRISIDHFFGATAGLTDIKDDELLTRIFIPSNQQSAWCEVGSRIGASHSIICCAASISKKGEVRLAFGGAAPAVCRVQKAEKVASVGGLSDQSIRKAMDVVRAEVKPITDWHGSAQYRREMCAIMTKRVLSSLRDTKQK
jgi:xanthine dehydrogenase small subunit